MVKSGAKSPKKAATRAKPRKSNKGLWVLGIITAAIVGLAFFYRAPISGYAGAGAAYTARVACSCRYIGNRDIDDCAKDKLSGMELISISENVEDKSVTARFPLIASETATYREGYGCVLEKWRD